MQNMSQNIQNNKHHRRRRRMGIVAGATEAKHEHIVKTSAAIISYVCAIKCIILIMRITSKYIHSILMHYCCMTKTKSWLSRYGMVALVMIDACPGFGLQIEQMVIAERCPCRTPIDIHCICMHHRYMRVAWRWTRIKLQLGPRLYN